MSSIDFEFVEVLFELGLPYTSSYNVDDTGDNAREHFQILEC